MNDPYNDLLRQQRYEIREKHGCAACERRDRNAMVWGKYLCGAGLTPGPRGFCRSWWLDDDFEED